MVIHKIFGTVNETDPVTMEIRAPSRKDFLAGFCQPHTKDLYLLIICFFFLDQRLTEMPFPALDTRGKYLLLSNKWLDKTFLKLFNSECPRFLNIGQDVSPYLVL